MDDLPETHALDAAEELLGECMELPVAEQEQALDELCRQHPDQAEELRGRFSLLRRMGFVGTGKAGEFPERLGEFRLIERLGGGGMGVVYRAEQEGLGREVALKIIRPDQLYFEGARERFRREVEAVAGLQHPGVVPIYTFGEQDGVPYFAMELVEGCTLAERLEELQSRSVETLAGRDLNPKHSGTWSEACLDVVLQVARSLEHVHERGMLHRDIKPSNIMLTPDGRALILDFGLAVRSGADKLTRTGSQVGSLLYMSPEQLRGETLDPRSDIYSLGVTLYEMLTLRDAFRADTVETTQGRILHGEARPPREINKRLSWDAETVCMVAMERDAARRYASAAELAVDVENVLEHRPVTARRPGRLLRTRRWVQRHPAGTVGLVLAAVVLVGAVGFAVQTARHSTELQSQLDEVKRLADVKLLEDLKREADEFYPLHPTLVERMDLWLGDARALQSRRELHDAALARLITTAADLQEVQTEQRTSAHNFEVWKLATLQTLVTELATLGDLVDKMQVRRDFADTVEERTVTGEEAESAWEEAILHIESSELYGGLMIEPQLGLLPLEPDPETGLWEFWHLETGERPERDPETDRWNVTSETGLVFVLLPGAEATLGTLVPGVAYPEGSPFVDPWSDRTQQYESPTYTVRLDPFLISKYEMTQAQWLKVIDHNPSRYPDGEKIDEGQLLTLVSPVERISWRDSHEAMRRLDLLLPTEAQWEYACRAGTTTVFHTGDRPQSLEGYANVRGAEWQPRYETEDWNDGFFVHAPVGSFLPNPFGLHDVHGNVEEWARDPFQTYDRVEPEDGDGARPDGSGLIGIMVFRGGSYGEMAPEAGSGRRRHFDRETRDSTAGVRPSRDLR